jgi:hypothetical protein
MGQDVANTRRIGNGPPGQVYNGRFAPFRAGDILVGACYDGAWMT